MDSFTQRILERTRLRREKLEQHFSRELELGLRQPLTENNNSKVLSQRGQLRNESVSTKSMGIGENILDNDDSENKLFESEGSASYSEPVGCSDSKSEQKSKHCKFGRLAELATRIKEWEDELDKPKQSSRSTGANKFHDKKGAIETTGESTKFSQPQGKKNDQQIIWDKNIIKSLESQGYALSQNESRLIYDFESDKEHVKKTDESSKIKMSPMKRLDADIPKAEIATKRICGNSPRINNENKDSAVLKKAAFFESHNRSSPDKTGKDPVELSIAERKALFEKNVGEALIPKVAFATPLPAKLAGGYSHKYGNVRDLEKVKPALDNFKGNKNMNNIHTQVDKAGKQTLKLSEESENIVKKRKELFEEGIVKEKVDEVPQTSDILSREKELEYLKNRWDHNKIYSEKETPKIPDPPPPPPMPQFLIKSPEKRVEIFKKPESNQNDSGRLYPSLSEFEEESDESDKSRTDSDCLNASKNSNIYLNMSFSDILEAKKNDPTSSNENSFNAELRESQVLSKMDEFLDNALNELSSTDDSDNDDGNTPSPPKMLKSSSFEYQSGNEETPANSLVHTVSFYRKQQQNSVNNQTPNSVRSIKREEHVTENEELEEEQVLVEKKIQELLQEINKQQTIISQASQALNLCLATVEFSGSGEQVESERLLLLANHKRQACLNEIQRLKVENTIRPHGSNQQLTEKGDVIITNISIPLKRDALRAMAAVESMQYLVCLIKSDERVIATHAVPATRDNLKNMALNFPGQYKLEKLLSDFKVTIEVYNLELNKEMLPHEVKYHISSKKDKKLLTPIKSKKTDSKLIMPYVQSPAGPNVVRTSNFNMCGYVVFSLREVTRTNWTLNKVPYTSPLEGSLSMKIESQLQLDMEFRGFLTMFDDISGFGAWHRRWCLLSSHTLSYWKYPDDESRKVPIGTIDLRGVVTENVGMVSRDICARLHTFLLETTRLRQEEDKESLVLNLQGDITRIRHLLSADSKEEMLVWCRKLNTTLALLRSWRCNFSV